MLTLERLQVSRMAASQSMFHKAAAFNSNLATWDVGRVVNMNSMFAYCLVFDQDLSAWDVRVRTTLLLPPDTLPQPRAFVLCLCRKGLTTTAPNRSHSVAAASRFS